MKLALFTLTIFTTFTLAAYGQVDFIKPLDKEEVPQTFTAEFSVQGMTVEKAGVMKKKTGHHHLIVDGKPIPKGQAVPKDATHFHLGDGATEKTLTLTPGVHTLTLQFADGGHVSLGPKYTKTITITVK